MGDGKVNWALVGIGDIAVKRVAPAILADPNSRLYVCVTRDPRKAAALGASDSLKVYSSLEPALDDPEIDALYLATPVHLHASHAIAALQAGKHVLVEKPMAMNADEAGQMCDAARRAGRSLAVAYYRRFWPRFQRVKDVLDAGGLGQVVQARVALQSWYAPARDDPKYWRVVPKLGGGGVLADVGSHRLDLLAWWFGTLERLVADCRTLTHDYAAEDSANLIMITKAAAPITASFHWNSKVWCDEIHITGTQAQITLNPCDGGDIEWRCPNVGDGRNPEREATSNPANAHAPMIADFASAIADGRLPRFGGEDGMAATVILDAVARSSDTLKWAETSERNPRKK